jgi:hypothetical protein
MRKVILSINILLDVFAHHTVAVVTDDELHDFFTVQVDEIDIAPFGRVTYELMESFRPVAHKDPNATRDVKDFASKFNATSKIVFSRSLEKAE